MSDFDISSLDSFEKEVLDKIENDSPEIIEELLLKIANEALEDLVRKTPLSTKKKPKSKHMKYKWKATKVKRIGNSYFIELKNKAPHAWLYENGHIAENGTFVKGAHLLEDKKEELQVTTVAEVKKAVEKFMGQI